jgi:ABC-type amino acid transport substrate-binding protein
MAHGYAHHNDRTDMAAAMIRARHMLALYLFLLMHGELAFAADKATSQAVLTAYTVPIAPWTFPEQPSRGIAPEYLRYLFDAAQVPVQLDTLPYLRAINGLRDGSNAAAILIPDAERDTFALRLCEIATIRSGVLYKKSRFKINDAQALAGLSVGVQRGSHALDKLANVPRIKRAMIETVDQGLRMLQIDRLDATFLFSPGVESMMQSHGLSPADYDWLEIEVEPVVVYVSRKSPLAADTDAINRLKNVCEGQAKPVMRKLMQAYR